MGDVDVMAKRYETDPRIELRIPQDSIFTRTITIEYEDGTAFDLTGCTCYLVAKSDPEDAIADAIINTNWNTHTDAANGETSYTLPADTTAAGTDKTLGTYYYNVRVTGTGVNFATPMGRLVIEPNPAKDAV